MVSDMRAGVPPADSLPVLILVLMEYGLWQNTWKYIEDWYWVLILVLMEYGLWHQVLTAAEKAALKS